MLIKPTRGLKVYDPYKKKFLKEEFAMVEDNFYWRRRLERGEVETKQVEKKKIKEKKRF